MERKEGDELSRIGRTIKLRRRSEITDPTAARAGDGHGKPRFARIRTNGSQPASQPTSQLCGRLAPWGVIYMLYEAGIEDKAELSRSELLSAHSLLLTRCPM